jgi:hypothetical protein
MIVYDSFPIALDEKICARVSIQMARCLYIYIYIYVHGEGVHESLGSLFWMCKSHKFEYTQVMINVLTISPSSQGERVIGSMISLRILQHFLRDNIQEVAMLPHFFILSLQIFVHCTILKLQLFNHYENSNPLCKLFPNFFLHFLVCILGFSFIP